MRRRGARLLERDHELSALDALIGDATTGGGRLLLVEGPAGIGKTQAGPLVLAIDDLQWADEPSRRCWSI